jgi:hypothetical protein
VSASVGQMKFIAGSRVKGKGVAGGGVKGKG